MNLTIPAVTALLVLLSATPVGETATADDVITLESLDELVGAHPTLRRCLAEAEARGVTLADKIWLEFRIHPDGRVSHARIVSEQHAGTPLDSCVSGPINQLVFVPPGGTQPQTVWYPILVSPPQLGDPEELQQAAAGFIEAYVHAPRPDCDDCKDENYDRTVELGEHAVVPLLEALENPAPEYQAKQLSFVCLLGQVGDERAYPALQELFQEQSGSVRRWRFAISLGSCLSAENVSDYVDLMVGDPSGGGTRALREMSGEEFDNDGPAWRKYLAQPDHLTAFVAACKRRSAPILG